MTDIATPRTEALIRQWETLEREEWRHFIEDKVFDEMNDLECGLVVARGALLEVSTKSEGGFTFCAFCNYTEQAGHAAHCVVGKALTSITQ